MSEKNIKLVIAEKPSVAQSIAKVIGADKREDGYLEGKRLAKNNITSTGIKFLNRLKRALLSRATLSVRREEPVRSVEK